MHIWTEPRVPFRERRRRQSGGFIRGQQVLMRALAHLRRQDAAPPVRDAALFLLHHITSQFRADDRLARPTVEPVGAVPAAIAGHGL